MYYICGVFNNKPKRMKEKKCKQAQNDWNHGVWAALSLLVVLVSWQYHFPWLFWIGLLSLVTFGALFINQSAEEAANSDR